MKGYPLVTEEAGESHITIFRREDGLIIFLHPGTEVTEVDESHITIFRRYDHLLERTEAEVVNANQSGLKCCTRSI